jgi:hypothetical protein
MAPNSAIGLALIGAALWIGGPMPAPLECSHSSPQQRGWAWRRPGVDRIYLRKKCHVDELGSSPSIMMARAVRPPAIVALMSSNFLPLLPIREEHSYRGVRKPVATERGSGRVSDHESIGPGRGCDFRALARAILEPAGMEVFESGDVGECLMTGQRHGPLLHLVLDR